MKSTSWLIMAVLLLLISCENLVYRYEEPDSYTTYYIGDSCIYTSGGTYIVDKSWYESRKNSCDRTEYFIIYQEDIVKDTIKLEYKYKESKEYGNTTILIPYGTDTLRYLDFFATKTNSSLDFGMISGISTNWPIKKKKNENILTAEIIPNIKLQKVDSIIIEIFWEWFPNY